MATYVGDLAFSKKYDYELYRLRFQQLTTLEQYCETFKENMDQVQSQLFHHVETLMRTLPEPTTNGVKMVIDMHSAAWYTNIVNALIGDLGIVLQMRYHQDLVQSK